MKQVQIMQNTYQEEWLKILGKGMVTLPKKWREDLGIENGDIIKAKKEGRKVILEVAVPTKVAPYRVYSDDEIDEFLEEDAIPKKLLQKIQQKFSHVLQI